jgi:uncharacterized damage-inducible protein DinB
MTIGLPDFYRQNLWANLRLLDTCARLSDEQLDKTMDGTFGSIRETLMHMLAAEEGYARHVTGKIPSPTLKECAVFPGFDELRRRARLSGELLIEAAGQKDLERILSLDGGTYECPAIIVMIQAINHGTDHRSQVATLLTQQGIEPPGIDAWDYHDAMRERS